MPKLSRQLPAPYTTAQIGQQLYDVIMLLENEDQVHQFFSTLLTVSEVKMLAKRLAIAHMYLSGASYQEITDELKVSPTTIARISSKLSDSQTVVKMLKQLKEIDKKRIEFVPQTSSPSDKYTRSTRAIGNLIGNLAVDATTSTFKTVRQKSRKKRVKSALIRRKPKPTPIL